MELRTSTETLAPPITAPTFAVVIPTCNRGESAVATVRSATEQAFPSFEIIVIDQSDNRDTRDALDRAGLLDNPRLRYEPTDTIGKGVALTEALNSTEATYLALVDDDCEVPTDWLSCLDDAFADQHVGLVRTTVVPDERYDLEAGFIPAWEAPCDPVTHDTLPLSWGMGASQAVRRKAIADIGGFDELMGPGGRFPSSDDGDLALRIVLIGGWSIHLTDKVDVVHYGYRTWAQGKELAKRDWTAVGAIYAKAIKGRRWPALKTCGYKLATAAIGKPVVQSFRARRPRGVRRIIYFAVGFAQGLRLPLDRDTGKFRMGTAPSPG